MTNALPETGYMRLAQIIGRHAKKGSPEIPPLIPVSKSTWWAGCRSGRYPKPEKLGQRITVWRVEDIRRLIEGERALIPIRATAKAGIVARA